MHRWRRKNTEKIETYSFSHSWSLYFCCSYICVNFLSKCLHVDGELFMLTSISFSLQRSPMFTPSPKISYGIVGGLGLGLMYVPAVTAVGYWFEKKRSLVTGEIYNIHFWYLDLQLVHILERRPSFIFCSVQESQHVVLDLGQLSSPQWWPNCLKCLTGSGPTGSSPDSASWYFLSSWQLLLSSCVLQLILISSSQCTFLGLTMKPVPKPKCDSIDSITEMKQKNGPIIKVCRIICHV